jgi:hypothetical protein
VLLQAAKAFMEAGMVRAPIRHCLMKNFCWSGLRGLTLRRWELHE